jgi:hypothetical protein
MFLTMHLSSSLTSGPPISPFSQAITNGGYQDSTTLVGDFPNLGKVYFNPDYIANILSLAAVMNVCRVTMLDSSSKKSLNIHHLDGTIMCFAEHPSGLFV